MSALPNLGPICPSHLQHFRLDPRSADHAANDGRDDSDRAASVRSSDGDLTGSDIAFHSIDKGKEREAH